MIEAGGDIRVFGGSAGRWRISIHDPRDDGYLSRIRLRNGAVATSGSYDVVNKMDGDRAEDPVIEPRTARSPEEDVCVSIVASTAERADALSTAAFVMDDTKAASTLEQVGAGGLFLPTGGEPIRTGSWGEFPGRMLDTESG
jgi:thiamine biosynthesis lipoprotein